MFFLLIVVSYLNNKSIVWSFFWSVVSLSEKTKQLFDLSLHQFLSSIGKNASITTITTITTTANKQEVIYCLWLCVIYVGSVRSIKYFRLHKIMFLHQFHVLLVEKRFCIVCSYLCFLFCFCHCSFTITFIQVFMLNDWFLWGEFSISVEIKNKLQKKKIQILFLLASLPLAVVLCVVWTLGFDWGLAVCRSVSLSVGQSVYPSIYIWLCLSKNENIFLLYWWTHLPHSLSLSK